MLNKVANTITPIKTYFNTKNITANPITFILRPNPVNGCCDLIIFFLINYLLLILKTKKGNPICSYYKIKRS